MCPTESPVNSLSIKLNPDSFLAQFLYLPTSYVCSVVLLAIENIEKFDETLPTNQWVSVCAQSTFWGAPVTGRMRLNIREELVRLRWQLRQNTRECDRTPIHPKAKI